MDHAQFVKSLPPETVTRLTARSSARGLVHLAGHLGLIIAFATPVALGWPLWWLFLPPLGIALIFLFTLEHECTHRTPFAHDRLSDTLGHISGAILLLPFHWFRYFHLAHHRFTHDPERDPELASPVPETWGPWLLYISGLPYWASMLRTIATQARGHIDDPFLPARRKPDVIREARILLALYALVWLSLFVSSAAVWLWILPVLLGQPFLRLYLMAEHTRCPHVADMFSNTRTTFTTRAMRFLAWNMPYHAEHHAMPQVPFHQLPALHQETAPHLTSTSDGYAEFTRETLETLS